MTVTDERAAGQARDLPHGLMVVGRFRGDREVTKRDGTVVPGLREVTVACWMGEFERVERASYFVEDHYGQASPMTQQLAAVAPEPGEYVAVSVSAKGSTSGDKAYVNLTATGIRRV